MQIGYNNDVQYRGKTFHIQTEDHGESAGAIETQLFHAGAIFDTSIVSYKSVLEETDDVDERIAKIRAMMQANHKSLYKKLLDGEYDSLAGLQPLEDGEEVEADDLVPGQERVPQSALEVEQGVRDFHDPGAEMGESVDLSKIHEALKQDAENAEKKEAIPPTVAMEPDGDVTRPPRNFAPATLIPDFAPSGALAFRGCEPPTEDTSILELVETFLAS